MSSSAQILRNNKTELTEYERINEFLKIITPIGYDTDIESDNAIYIKPKDNNEKGVRIWVEQEDYPIYLINGKEYYREVFFEFVWDDESVNSDMILVITAEYMKKFPDALFQYEGRRDDSMFMDKTDIDTLISQPFQPSWFYLHKSHLNSSRVNVYDREWILE